MHASVVNGYYISAVRLNVNVKAVFGTNGSSNLVNEGKHVFALAQRTSILPGILTVMFWHRISFVSQHCHTNTSLRRCVPSVISLCHFSYNVIFFTVLSCQIIPSAFNQTVFNWPVFVFVFFADNIVKIKGMRVLFLILKQHHDTIYSFYVLAININSTMGSFIVSLLFNKPIWNGPYNHIQSPSEKKKENILVVYNKTLSYK